MGDHRGSLRLALDRPSPQPDAVPQTIPTPAGELQARRALAPAGDGRRGIWTRVWLALVEVGRHCHRVGAVIDLIEAEERALIVRMLGRGGDPLEAEAVAAMVRELRHAICAPETPMSVRMAHAVLARQWTG
ncbi:MAG: hypothetical protein ACRDOZ_04800 [Nocardioides sp.]